MDSELKFLLGKLEGRLDAFADSVIQSHEDLKEDIKEIKKHVHELNIARWKMTGSHLLFVGVIGFFTSSLGVLIIHKLLKGS